MEPEAKSKPKISIIKKVKISCLHFLTILRHEYQDECPKRSAQQLLLCSLHVLEHVDHPHLLALVRFDDLAQAAVGILKQFLLHLIFDVPGIAWRQFESSSSTFTSCTSHAPKSAPLILRIPRLPLSRPSRSPTSRHLRSKPTSYRWLQWIRRLQIPWYIENILTGWCSTPPKSLEQPWNCPQNGVPILRLPAHVANELLHQSPRRSGLWEIQLLPHLSPKFSLQFPIVRPQFEILFCAVTCCTKLLWLIGDW